MSEKTRGLLHELGEDVVKGMGGAAEGVGKGVRHERQDGDGGGGSGGGRGGVGGGRGGGRKEVIIGSVAEDLHQVLLDFGAHDAYLQSSETALDSIAGGVALLSRSLDELTKSVVVAPKALFFAQEALTQHTGVTSFPELPPIRTTTPDDNPATPTPTPTPNA